MIKIKLEAIPAGHKNQMKSSSLIYRLIPNLDDTQFFFIVMKSGTAPLIATAMSRSKTKKDRVYKASESIITPLFLIYKCKFKEYEYYEVIKCGRA